MRRATRISPLLGFGLVLLVGLILLGAALYGMWITDVSIESPQVLEGSVQVGGTLNMEMSGRYLVEQSEYKTDKILFEAIGVPTGMAVSFTPNPIFVDTTVPGAYIWRTTVTVSAGPSVAVGQYSMKVRARSEVLNKSCEVLMVVNVTSSPPSPPGEPPTARTLGVEGLGTNYALVSGELVSLGSTPSVRYFWVYGLNPTNLSRASDLFESSEIGKKTTKLSDLAPDTTYYYQFVAYNSYGYSYGEINTFRTEAEGAEQYQYGVWGYVLSEDNQPIAGAEVFVYDRLKATTGETGYYSLELPSQGVYDLFFFKKVKVRVPYFGIETEVDQYQPVARAGLMVNGFIRMDVRMRESMVFKYKYLLLGGVALLLFVIIGWVVLMLLLTAATRR